MHVTTFSESEIIDLKESTGCYVARFKGKKQRGKQCNYNLEVMF